MTEDEAKTKMCCGPPFVGAALLLASPKGSPIPGQEPGTCIASACMAWRTQRVLKLGRSDPEGDGWTKDSPANAEGTSRWYRDEGFCGLAGAPQ